MTLGANLMTLTLEKRTDDLDPQGVWRPLKWTLTPQEVETQRATL